MSGEPTRKRAGREEPGEDPPRKIASGQLAEAESDQNDVVIIVGKCKFRCKKEKLSSTSKYFEKMFNSGFSEKGQKEVKLGGIATVEGFKLFLDVIEGSDTLTDECVEQALSLADYLESPVLEERCVEFLSLKSKYSKEEQFALGDKHNSMKLITQLCSDIKDSYELHEIVPVDINSLKSSTKTIVLQKSFELLGHRKLPAPPVPQRPESEFEAMIGELIDQAAIVHHHGTILADQALLLFNHVILEKGIDTALSLYQQFVEEDPRIPIMMNLLRNASNQIERNGIRAQLQVLEEKKWHAAVEFHANNGGPRDRLEGSINSFCESLKKFPDIINRDKKTEKIAIQNHPTGERTIDVSYRNITREFEERESPERELDDQPSWLQMFRDVRILPLRFTYRQRNVQVPDGLRQISREFNFGLMEEFVANIREIYYNVRLQPAVNDEPAQAAPHPEGEHQNDGDGLNEGVEDQDGQE